MAREMRCSWLPKMKTLRGFHCLSLLRFRRPALPPSGDQAGERLVANATSSTYRAPSISAEPGSACNPLTGCILLEHVPKSPSTTTTSGR